MSTHPIAIIANAIRTADGDHTLGAGALAEIAAEVLTDPAIVDNAVQALKGDGWEETPEGPMGMYQMSDDDLTNIALAVLRSVAGGA